MMEWTDRHCRYFLRLISRHAWLYTEMATTGAVLHGNRARFLGHDAAEHPLALQLGGSDPEALARCAAIGEAWGFDEINLNVGCPSDRVQAGRFGACLMREPELVAECVRAMCGEVSIPVSVKTRIGVDEHDSHARLSHFVETIADAGCRVFIIHARKAWLQGLSPRQNRNVPPLCYDRVYRIKRDFPSLEIVLNGGVKTLDQAGEHLEQVDGVMYGREGYHNPWLLAQVDRRFYGDPHEVPTREQVLRSYITYARDRLAAGDRLGHLARHVLGLRQGERGARSWRRFLSENMYRKGAGIEVLEQAADLLAGRDAKEIA